MESVTKTLLESAKSQVKDILPGAVNDETAKKILQRYTAAIEGNFVAWMGSAAICARSVQGRHAASENLWVEMKDDHAGMLRAFAKHANAEPQHEDYQTVEESVQNVRSLVAEMSGLKTLTLMAVLENTSSVFVPFLEQLAIRLGSTNTHYTTVHGEADIMHADQFTWAVEHEMEHYENGAQDIEEAMQITIEFLKNIFQYEAS